MIGIIFCTLTSLIFVNINYVFSYSDDDDDEYDSVEFEGSVDGESRNSEELNIAADIRCISNSPINSYDSVLSTRQTRASRAPHVALDSMPSVDSHRDGNKDKNEIVPEIKKKRDEKEVLGKIQSNI